MFGDLAESSSPDLPMFLFNMSWNLKLSYFIYWLLNSLPPSFLIALTSFTELLLVLSIWACWLLPFYSFILWFFAWSLVFCWWFWLSGWFFLSDMENTGAWWMLFMLLVWESLESIVYLVFKAFADWFEVSVYTLCIELSFSLALPVLRSTLPLSWAALSLVSMFLGK